MGPPKDRDDVRERMRRRSIDTVEGLLGLYGDWLYLEPQDFEALEVVLAAALDRELPGDPAWLMFVAPSGGVKTEVLRSLSSYPRAFSLDFLTPKALVSGLTRLDRETKEYIPIAGLLSSLDGKVLVLKDFTTILSSAEETRTAIYGQLRSAYDGYFEGGFGTLKEPIRVRATFGLVAGVTPAIHRYTKMKGALGERFLMVRSSPNPVKAARRARRNVGLEEEMRAQLAGSVAATFEALDFSRPPPISEEQAEEIIRIGYYIALMRSRVWVRWYQGSIVDLDAAEPEVPTRVSKQLSKLAQLLAVLRGHEDVEDPELATLRRVARDTVVPRRQRIVDVYYEAGGEQVLSTADIAGRAVRVHYQSVKNETQIMVALGILEMDEHGNYRLIRDFAELMRAAYPIP